MLGSFVHVAALGISRPCGRISPSRIIRRKARPRKADGADRSFELSIRALKCHCSSGAPNAASAAVSTSTCGRTGKNSRSCRPSCGTIETKSPKSVGGLCCSPIAFVGIEGCAVSEDSGARHVVDFQAYAVRNPRIEHSNSRVPMCPQAGRERWWRSCSSERPRMCRHPRGSAHEGIGGAIRPKSGQSVRGAIPARRARCQSQCGRQCNRRICQCRRLRSSPLAKEVCRKMLGRRRSRRRRG